VLDPSLDHAAAPPTTTSRSTRIADLGRGLDAALGLLAGLSFVGQLIVSSMLPIVPVFAQQLGATPILLAAMVSISAVASAGGQILGGAAAIRIGARRLLPVGFAAYGAATLLTALATVAGPVVALRGVTGLGSGVFIIGERLYVRQVVDGARLAFGNGLVQAAAAVGLIVGPLLGGVIADASTLKTTFVLIGMGSLFVAVIAWRLPSRRHLDSVDASLPGASFAVDPRVLPSLFLAALALAAGYGSFITTFAPFVTDELRWTAAQTGLAFSLFGLGNVVGAPWLGGLADRRGRRLVGSLATIPLVALAGALILPTPTILLYLLALIAGIGLAGFNASWYALLGAATGGPEGGRAFGTVAGLSSLGAVVGALLAGRLWESVDIRTGMVVTVLAMAAAGLILAASRPAKPVALPS
jgi:MFS family permease